MLDGMTNIKAREVLKEIKYYTEDLPPYSPDEVAEALEMAIKALEAQPSEDCISRQAVDDAIYDYSRSCDVNYEQIMEFIDKLPSITPKAEPCEDCISILNRIMEYTYGMLTAEKIGLQHLIKSMIDEMNGGGEDEVSN